MQSSLSMKTNINGDWRCKRQDWKCLYSDFWCHFRQIVTISDRLRGAIVVFVVGLTLFWGINRERRTCPQTYRPECVYMLGKSTLFSHCSPTVPSCGWNGEPALICLSPCTTCFGLCLTYTDFISPVWDHVYLSPWQCSSAHQTFFSFMFECEINLFFWNNLSLLLPVHFSNAATHAFECNIICLFAVFSMLAAQYFASTMMIVGMSVVVTVIVLQFHHHDPQGGKMPKWVSETDLTRSKTGNLFCPSSVPHNALILSRDTVKVWVAKKAAVTLVAQFWPT